ncbi:uncharacterized protein METZ01_LOCUS119911 [marine metagenome]|uniref:Uncharacterized protein n=1 Tax=marine metagenome TaxID=408172 RepID=A0A381XS85_9ZZZZ
MELISMKRIHRNPVDYITVRKAQLREDRDKASKDYDRQWYNRLIQELDWAGEFANNKLTRNCYMEEVNE